MTPGETNGRIRSPLLHGRYLISDPIPRFALQAIDAVLDRIPNGATGSTAAPERLLLAVGGHLGDAIIATSAIAFARTLLPRAEIGVIAASWARMAIDGNPHVRRVHEVDHWKVNRARLPVGSRVRRFASTWGRALREIRDARYDMAIDLYPYYPNSAPLLRAAGIPVRVGYTSAGFGALYTQRVDFVDEPAHQVELAARLIAHALGRAENGANGTHPPAPLGYQLPAVESSAHQSVLAKLAAAGLVADSYVVVHMAAATSQREWSPDRWRATLEHLIASGEQIVCTGLAGREWTIAEQAIHGLPRTANLCGQLSWTELCAAVSRARAVVSVDTAIAHIAAAYDVPTVTLMAAMARPEDWRPYGPRNVALSHPMPCAPCFLRQGCAHMSCVREIEVSRVLTSMTEQLHEC